MKFGLILILLFHFINPNETSELIKIRNLYEQAALKEVAYVSLNNLLGNTKLNTPLLIGYNGANTMIGANYVFNPISKLNRFNKGKKLIEHAIGLAPNHAELRYIRFSIQTNLPSFLGYKDNINEDKQFMMKQMGSLTDNDLRERIINYLLFYKKCTASEIQQLLVWKNK